MRVSQTANCSKWAFTRTPRGNGYKISEGRNRGQWIVTDLNTGLSVNYGKTRVDAVKKFQDMYLSKLERMVYSNEHYSCVPSCHENYYEHMTAEFQAMLKEGAK